MKYKKKDGKEDFETAQKRMKKNIRALVKDDIFHYNMDRNLEYFMWQAYKEYNKVKDSHPAYMEEDTWTAMLDDQTMMWKWLYDHHHDYDPNWDSEVNNKRILYRELTSMFWAKFGGHLWR